MQMADVFTDVMNYQIDHAYPALDTPATPPSNSGNFTTLQTLKYSHILIIKIYIYTTEKDRSLFRLALLTTSHGLKCRACHQSEKLQGQEEGDNSLIKVITKV